MPILPPPGNNSAYGGLNPNDPDIATQGLVVGWRTLQAAYTAAFTEAYNDMETILVELQTEFTPNSTI